MQIRYLGMHVNLILLKSEKENLAVHPAQCEQALRKPDPEQEENLSSGTSQPPYENSI